MDKESALFYVVLLLFAVTGIVTILGLVQKVSIEKKYLNALFSALVLELIAAVLYMFSSTNFFDQGPAAGELLLQRDDLPPAYSELSAGDLVSLLAEYEVNRQRLAQLETELLNLKNEIDDQVPPYAAVTLELDEKGIKIENLRAERDRIQAELKESQRFEKHFLVRMVTLNTEISALGGSVNLEWEPEQKRHIAGMLQAAFKQIGFMESDEQPDDDPTRALRLLVRYQESKNFGETGFLTAEVVAIIIRDYLAPVSGRENGGDT